MCIRDRAKTDGFCPNCGCPVSKEDSVQTIKKSNKKPIIIITIIGIIIAFCIIGFLVLKLNDNPVQKYVSLFNSNKSEQAVSLYNEKIEGKDVYKRQG